MSQVNYLPYNEDEFWQTEEAIIPETSSLFTGNRETVRVKRSIAVIPEEHGGRQFFLFGDGAVYLRVAAGMHARDLHKLLRNLY